MSFSRAVRATPTIATCFQEGLGAVKGEHRRKISSSNPREWSGSVNLDDCYFQRRQLPSFDYLIGHREQALFVEVHPATTGEVDRMIAKKNSMHSWLNDDAKEIKKILIEKPYIWLSTGGVKILSNSNYARRLAQSGIRFPKEFLRL